MPRRFRRPPEDAPQHRPARRHLPETHRVYCKVSRKWKVLFKDERQANWAIESIRQTELAKAHRAGKTEITEQIPQRAYACEGSGHCNGYHLTSQA